MQNHNFYLPHLMVRGGGGSLPRVIENYPPAAATSCASITQPTCSTPKPKLVATSFDANNCPTAYSCKFGTVDQATTDCQASCLQNGGNGMDKCTSTQYGSTPNNYYVCAPCKCISSSPTTTPTPTPTPRPSN